MSKKCRVVPNLTLRQSGDDSSSDFRDLVKPSFSDLCGNLVSLNLQKCNITELTLIPILRKCYNLQNLNLEGCNTLFMSGQILSNEDDRIQLKESLTNLKSLNLSSIRYLSDATFSRFMNAAENLEKLSLNGNEILFHSDRIYKQAPKADSVMFTFNTIHSFIKKRASTFKSLDFGKTSLPNHALITIGNTKDLKLEEIILAGCKEFSEDTLGEFCVLQPDLSVLDISWCTELTDTAIHKITENLPKLQKLSFGNIRLVSNVAGTWLDSLSQLEYLSIPALYNFKSPSLITGLLANETSKLTYLDVSSCTGLDDQFFVALSKKAPNLTYLDAGSCLKLSDISLHHISGKLSKLKFLRLMWCSHVTDYGLLGLFPPEELHKHIHEEGLCRCTRKPNGFGHMTNIHFPDQEIVKLTKEEVELRYDNQEERWPISLLTQLNVLNLAGCSKITKLSLSRVMTFSDLQELNLNMIHCLDDETLIAIVKQNRSLEKLYVSKCRSLTDASVFCIAQTLRRLTHLDISCNDTYTNRSMQAIATYCNRLQLLDVSMCGNITLDAAEQVEHHLPHLNTVHSRLTGIKRKSLTITK